MKNIALLNVYDIRNRGDLAILLCQMEWLQRRFPQAQFRLFSRFYELNARQFGDRSVRSILGTRPEAGAVAQLFEMAQDYWHTMVRGSRTANARLRAFYDADLYGLTGGGYLYSSRFPVVSRNLINVCQTFQLALRTGKPVIQFPQSYGPFTKGADVHHVKKLCESLPRLSPRCALSKRILDEWGFGAKAAVIPDIVFLMRKLLPDYFGGTPSRRGLGIAPVECRFAMAVTDEERETYLDKLAAAGAFFHAQTGEPVTLFSQVHLEGSDDDSPAVNDLAAKLARKGVPVAEVKGDISLQDYLGEFQKLRLFIGSRMHACIFAFVSHTPVAGLAYQPKFIGTFETMAQPDWVKPIKDWSEAWINDWITQNLAGGDNLCESIKTRLITVENQIEDSMGKALETATGVAHPSNHH